MKKAMAFVSDLHLGALPALDDFALDERFAVLLARLAEGGWDACELVLLGDTFDAWQAVDAEECAPDEIAASAKLPSTVPLEQARLDAIRARHRRWFDALAGFVAEPRHAATFVAGNHDHALVDPAIQQHVRSLCGGAPSVRFERAVDRPEFALYGEHGNQFDFNNRYRNFAAWEPGRECRGYYFVRYFWNWLEFHLPRLTDTSSEWSRFWHEVRREPKLLPRAFRRFTRYVRAVKTQVVLPLEEAVAEGAETPLLPPGSPTLLLMGAAGPNVFTDDPVMEQAFRQAYRDDPDMRAEVDALLAAQGRTPHVPPPEQVAEIARSRVEATEGVATDVVWAERLFSDGTVLGPRLDPARVRFVLLGHTHGLRDETVPVGARYVNTGTWTHGPKDDVPVVLAQSLGGDVRLDVRRLTARGTLE
jgi:UDP-2,3-diacylglucosamine pyrophosphatase LpxH